MPHASQHRWVGALMRVHMSHVQLLPVEREEEGSEGGDVGEQVRSIGA